MNGLEMFSLKGRTALVTGASRGIGEALCVALARAGADIIGVARSPESLAPVGKEVERAGCRFHALACDVADVGSIEGLFATLREMDLTPEILVNNAGMEQVAPSLDVSESLWDRIVDTNLKGAFFVARGFV
ncbi:MAG TPA: SDR family NAD(P)-dependent oxidoreductase, partial [Devosia sp.]|nr:SDR family NAD(P)-dependent oxidoreductase [Devosia sp.]